MSSKTGSPVSISIELIPSRILAAFGISFAARAIYSYFDHRFCYSAIASSGIVLILPGFPVSE